MKLERIICNNSQRLLLVFSGWASDASFFIGTVPPEGYDFMVASDYRQPASRTQTEEISRYSEVCVVAWSFGVPAAHRFMAENPDVRFTLRVAINGTLAPVHDRLGIPEMIFRGTLDRLDTRNLSKFLRRAAGSSEAYTKLPQASRFDISNLKEELLAIAKLQPVYETDLWDSVIISTDDAIIPPDNQRRFWSFHSSVREIQAPHLPDFPALLPSLLCDKHLIAQRFTESAQTYNANAGVQRDIARRLSELWNSSHPDTLRPTLEIGTGTGLLTKEISKAIDPGNLTLWDLADIPDSLPGHKVKCDAETAISECRENYFGSILSASTLQWFNSPAGFLKKAHRALSPGGILAVSTFTPDNYRELRPFLHGSPRYMSADTIRSILPDGFEVIEITEERITVDFPSTIDLLRHIKLTGVNAVQQGSPSVARSIISAGVTRLTYSPVYLIARKKR